MYLEVHSYRFEGVKNKKEYADKQRTLSLSIGQGIRRAFSDLSNGMPSERVFLKSSAAKTNPVHGLSSTGSWVRIKMFLLRGGYSMPSK
jgi:hypothetical protein